MSEEDLAFGGWYEVYTVLEFDALNAKHLHD